MRILQYIQSMLPIRGGTARAVSDLGSALAARGHQVTIWTGEVPEGAVVGEYRPGVPTMMPVDVKLDRMPRFSRHERGRLRSLLGGYDIIHLHGMWSLANVQIGQDALKARVPYVTTVHGMLDNWSMAQGTLHKRAFMALWGRSHLENAGVVQLTAAAEEAQARRWFPKGRTMVVSNILDLTPFRDPPGPEMARDRFPRLAQAGRDGKREPMILFLSRVHHKKGVDTLLKAVAEVNKRGVACVIAVAGTGDDAYVESLKKLAETLGIADRVVWTGHIGGPLKISLYQAADIFALPTHSENFGYVFPEAMASGTPVLTTKGVDIWPELESSGAATILDITVEAFANELHCLLTNPAALEAMRAKARPWTFETFNEGAITAQYEAMYASCAKKK